MQFVYIYILCKKNWYFISLWLEMRIFFMSAEVSVFQQDQTTITQEDPKGFTWHKH